jgi:hypothetical protein
MTADQKSEEHKKAILAGMSAGNNLAAAIELLEEGFSVKTALGSIVEFNRTLLDKYLDGSGRAGGDEPFRLKNLGRAVLAVKAANQGVFQTETTKGFIKRAYIHLTDNHAGEDKMITVFEYVYQDGEPYIGGFIYERYNKKRLKHYRQGVKIKNHGNCFP